ncbi:MAG TPA: PIG-L family deacetylase [Acidimicrobiales bacterium]|nr:PIG-L family deacetylase [Acidimicrobiales bacterium]
MPHTVVSFHAHPDDEALLTAGTLARAAAEGHRVVIVTATAGELGLVRGELADGLAERRLQELREAAAALGCRDVRHLGYLDSGMDGNAEGGFASADPDQAAARLAAVLEECAAEVLTIYDPVGGYGHPDHIQVHRVGLRAAAAAGTPVVLEATVDRRPLVRILRVLERTGLARLLGVDRAEWNSSRFRARYAEPDRITHRVDVRGQAPAKRAAMAAHASQGTADSGVRTLSVFLRLPPWLFGRVFAHEWFVEQGRLPAEPPLDDIFASLSPPAGPSGSARL